MFPDRAGLVALLDSVIFYVVSIKGSIDDF